MGFGTTLLLIFLALVGAAAAFIYFVGLPEEWTDAAQQKIAEQVGENAASDAIRDQIKNLPKAERQRANQMNKGLAKATGVNLKSGASEAAGDVASFASTLD